FFIGNNEVTNDFFGLSIDSPRAKFSDCNVSIDGLKVKDIIGKQFLITLNDKKIGRDKISAY
ncbi:354_t:CDS:1, partial [Entrophospora sp. SA101]